MTSVRSKLSLRLLPLVLALIAIAACGNVTPAAAPESSAPGAAANAADAGTSDDRAGWPETFRMGYFGGDDAEEVVERVEPFRQYMEERLGIPVEVFTGTSYTAVIEAMRADRVDAMSVGPFSYILAVQEAQAEALAVGVSSRADPPVYDPSLPAHYISVIFTKKGSGIETLDDLRGNDFTFVDPASTSGHLAPKTRLIQHGLNPDTEMNTVFAGSHPSSAIAVWNDKAPAGATNEGNLLRLDREGQVEWCAWPDGQISKVRSEEEIREAYEACPEGHLVILAMSDPIPSTPFAIRTELPESFKAEVKQALLDIKDNPELIAETGRWYVDPTEELGLESLDQYYNSLRDIARLLDLDLKELAEQ